MSPDEFSNQIDTLLRRCIELWRDNPEQTHSIPLLSGTLQELGISVEELRVAEEQLRQQNEMLMLTQSRVEAERARYQDHFHSAPEAYVVTDSSGIVTEVNRQVLRLLCITSQSLIGKPLSDFIPRGDRRDFNGLLVGAFEPTGTAAMEMRLIADGRARAVSVSVAAAPGGEQRWLIRPLSADSELERFRLLVAEVKDYAIILMDRRGTILDWNAGAEQVFGYSAEETQGRPASLLFTQEDRTRGEPALERRKAGKTGRVNGSRWMAHKDGSPRWVSSSLTALGGSDERVRWFANVLQDRTEDRVHEQQMFAVATRLQGVVQPLTTADPPGLALRTYYRPALAEAVVGGDFFDIFDLGGGRSALVIGDVSGKGLDAAAQVGILRSMLRAFLYSLPTAAEAVNELNRVLAEHELLAGFATLFVAIHEAATDTLVYVNCGQEPALIRRADGSGIERLLPTGSVLGIDATLEFDEERLALRPGDALVAYTDGLTDIGPSRTQMLGEERVVALAREGTFDLDDGGARRIADLLAGRLIRAVEEFGADGVFDDVCVLVAVVKASQISAQAESNADIFAVSEVKGGL